MTPPKEYSRLPATDPKEMEIKELSDYSKYYIIILNMLGELQGNTEKEFNEFSITMKETKWEIQQRENTRIK